MQTCTDCNYLCLFFRRKKKATANVMCVIRQKVHSLSLSSRCLLVLTLPCDLFQGIGVILLPQTVLIITCIVY